MNAESGSEQPFPPEFPTSPAWNISNSCLQYMMQRTELRDFNNHYHELATQAIQSIADLEGQSNLHRRYLSFRQFYLENLVCRGHDFFVQYFENALLELIMQTDNFVLDTDWKKVSDFLKVGLPEADRRAELASLIVERLARPSRLNEFCAFVRKRTEIELFPVQEEKNFALSVSAVRNAIVHNDGEVNKRFLKRVEELNFSIETTGGRIKIDEKWILEGAILLDQIIFRFDHEVLVKFSIPSRFRPRVVWMRSIPD